MKLEVNRHTHVFRWFSKDIFWRLLMTILHMWHDWDVFSLKDRWLDGLEWKSNVRPRSLQLVAPAHSTRSAVVYWSHESLCVAVCCIVLQCLCRGLTVSWESLRTLLILCEVFNLFTLKFSPLSQSRPWKVNLLFLEFFNPWLPVKVTRGKYFSWYFQCHIQSRTRTPIYIPRYRCQMVSWYYADARLYLYQEALDGR